MALGALLWGLAPFTGRIEDPVIDLSISTPRYLLPTLATAAATLALAARRHRAATWVLAAAALWSLERTLAIPFPGAPSAALLLAGAAAGAVAGLLWRRAAPPRIAVAVVAAAVAVAGLTAAADDMPRRHAEIGQISGAGVIAWLEDRAGDDDLHFAPGILGVAAGERLQRDLRFIPRDEPCASVRMRRGWVVIALIPNPDRRTPFTARDCFDGVVPAYEEPYWRVYDRRQTTSTSRHESSPSARTEKSPGSIAAARGSSSRRARVSRRS